MGKQRKKKSGKTEKGKKKKLKHSFKPGEINKPAEGGDRRELVSPTGGNGKGGRLGS